MGIVNVDPKTLTDYDLLKEHDEIHRIWSLLNIESTEEEVVRWKFYRPALADRHDVLVEEIRSRDIIHNSPIYYWKSINPIWPGEPENIALITLF